ncbi:membrane protein YqaA with SNARE-associated domain [Spinactinospora alkalitolerans]|uniref:Membrane protein YqaA with SNARE-associated domain n=1 Tax=Spinactinospora alkalitolerans TaxID=687207 RepID=A0A852TPM8_9ACTN|nr:VTT domain-containing protein [Spinactinospora alkalitolerans]NYE45949.1 membrane protein YqaA with SNARE-associated domain [Spinactinospora alkalitolerans]
MTQTALAFLVGLTSALLPFVNIEIYLVSAAALAGDGVLLVTGMAVAAGAGQTLGKVAYYYMGRGVLNVPWLRRRAEKPGKWSERAAGWREKAQRRPVWAAGLVAVSSFASIPPFMVVSVLAGTVRMPLPVFLVITMATRTVRFLILVYAPGVAAAVLP